MLTQRPSAVDLVEVTATGPDRYRPVTETPLSRPTLFGGALLGQALRAAADTVADDRPPHALHAHFVRAGYAGRGLEFAVARVRDGRSFSTREVTAHQGDRVVMTATASFHVEEPSDQYQAPLHHLDRPPPPDRGQAVGGMGTEVVELAPDDGAREPRYRAWARTARLPTDPVLHACLLALLSDSGAPGVAAAAIGLQAGGPNSDPGSTHWTTSLNHAMWFHRSGRCDDWVFLDAVPLSTAGSRGLLLGTVHDQAGRHLASFTQELLIRRSGDSPEPLA